MVQIADRVARARHAFNHRWGAERFCAGFIHARQQRFRCAGGGENAGPKRINQIKPLFTHGGRIREIR